AQGSVGPGDRLQRPRLDVIGRDIETFCEILDGGAHVRSRLAGLFGGGGSRAGPRRRGLQGGGLLRWGAVTAVTGVDTHEQQHRPAGGGYGGAETVAHGPRIVRGAAGVLSFLGGAGGVGGRAGWVPGAEHAKPVSEAARRAYTGPPETRIAS